MHITDLISKVVVEVVSGLVLRTLVFLLKHTYQFASRTIEIAKRKQMGERNERSSTYADIEELLGEFVEKYKEMVRQTPALTRWELLFGVVIDTARLTKSLIVMAVGRFIASDEIPRA